MRVEAAGNGHDLARDKTGRLRSEIGDRLGNFLRLGHTPVIGSRHQPRGVFGRHGLRDGCTRQPRRNGIDGNRGRKFFRQTARERGYRRLARRIIRLPALTADAKLTIRPTPPFSMPGAKARIRWKLPIRLRSSVARNRASSICRKGV